MIDRATKKVCACPLNGKACVDGSREDFADDPIAAAAGVPAKLKCRWWERLAGKDPQSEKLIDEWDCAVAWLPITTIESAQMSRQTGASVDKVANEVANVKQGITGMAAAIKVAAAGISQAIESGALTVMLPSPNSALETNGHESRELKEGEKPNEN